MFNITNEDIKELLEKYKRGEQMPYSLEKVMLCGLKYIYGEVHYTNGKVEGCETNFGDFIHTGKPHKCQKTFVKTELKKLKIPDSIFSCWAGNNIAIVSTDNTLHAYYKDEHLFETKMKDISAMTASNTKIYLGTFSGNLIHYDPVSQSENTQNRHSGTITSVRCVETPNYGNYVLTSSTDGTIFFRKSIKISNCEILDSVYVQDNHFICACSDNSISVYKSGELRSYVGHKSRINTLTYDKIAVTTSSDGFLGMLSQNKGIETQEMRNIGCSLHKQMGGGKVLGFGMEGLKIYDIGSDSLLSICNNKQAVDSADMFNSTVVYASDSTVNFCDVRSKEKFRVWTGGNINNIEFNSTGDMIFVSSDDFPSMIELRMG